MAIKTPTKVVKKRTLAEPPIPKKAAVKVKKSETRVSLQLVPALKKSKYFPSADSPTVDRIITPQPVDPRVLWDPPKSPYKFIQESLYKNPWQLLVATIFLNKTSGKAACPLVSKFLERWPSAETVSGESKKEIAELMNPLGLQEIRATRIVKMSGDYLNKKWENASELYGISKYGQDSYRIFCRGEWKDVRPTDIMLRIYQDWIWTNQKALKLE